MRPACFSSPRTCGECRCGLRSMRLTSGASGSICPCVSQLTRMRRYGVLGRYIPEFGRVIGQHHPQIGYLSGGHGPSEPNIPDHSPPHRFASPTPPHITAIARVPQEMRSRQRRRSPLGSAGHQGTTTVGHAWVIHTERLPRGWPALHCPGREPSAEEGVTGPLRYPT